MKQDSSLVKNHSHDSIAQVAWLYHVGNLSQQEISDRQHFTLQDRSLACRGKTARRSSHHLEHNSTTLELADELTKRFGLKEAQVARAAKWRQRGCAAGCGNCGGGILARIALAKPADHCGTRMGSHLGHMADNLVGVTNPDITFCLIDGAVEPGRSDATGRCVSDWRH